MMNDPENANVRANGRRAAMNATGAVTYLRTPSYYSMSQTTGNGSSSTRWITSAVNFSATPADLGAYICTFTSYAAVNTTVYLFGALLYSLDSLRLLRPLLCSPFLSSFSSLIHSHLYSVHVQFTSKLI